jgi:hypothetical protein
MVPPALVAAKAASASYTGPLDIVGGAVVAYGQRALSSAKRGSALYTIRRSSDSTTHSYNSDATTGDAPSAAISTFIGAGNGFATVWTDQSGNGSDAVQATAANQPQWTPTGANSTPALITNSTTPLYLATSANVTLPSGAYTTFVVFKRTGEWISFWGVNVDYSSYVLFSASTHNSADPTAPFALNIDAFDGTNEAGELTVDATGAQNWSLYDAAWQFGSGDARINGVALARQNSVDSGGTVASIAQPLAICADETTEAELTASDGQTAEILIYDGILSDANRLAIRQNIAAYYGITLS